MKPIYLLLGALALSLCCAPVADAQAPNIAETAQRERDATASALVRLISARLDNSFWSVNYEPQFDLIEVQSRNPAWIEPEVIINGSPFEERKPTSHLFGFALRVKPLVSPAEYVQFKAENAAIYDQMAQMQTQMKGISHKFDSYLPKNAAEKARVDAYNGAKTKIHALPLFYFRNLSLSVAFYDGHPIFDYNELFDSEIQTAQLPLWQRQQKAAALTVAKLLTRYEPATP